MSSALAIAGVTAVLRDLLNDGLINHDATAALGVSITVSIGPPDRVISANGGSESTQLNLFMYHVTPNTGWRNESLPSRDSSGRQRLTNAPLALNLHYLISAHAKEDLHGDILLGYAMQFLHERPALSREAIRKALNPSPQINGEALTPTMKALADSGLESQIEQIKITPEYLSTEEISKLWTATQSHLRPAAVYMASVVLIEAKEPAHTALPVLTRGPVIKPKLDQSTWYERGIVVEPDLVPPLPMLEAVIPAEKQPAAQVDKPIELHGHHLDAKPGTTRKVRLVNDRFKVDQNIDATDPPPLPKISASSILFSIPAEFPVGIYSVSALLQSPDQNDVRGTNRLAMILVPTITNMSPSSVSNGVTLRIEFAPRLFAGQEAVLVLGQQEFLPQIPATYPTAALDFVIEDAPVSPNPGLLVRLRIDGFESPIIDRTATPSVFFDKRITVT